MIPAAFDYQAPASLQEAISILEGNDEAKILAGGHSLLPLMKLRLSAPGLLVDLARVPNLSYIEDRGDHVAIGAMTPHVQLEGSDLLRQRAPLLAQTAGLVGDMQVRNRGTLGGSLAHADPAADLPSAVTALHGRLVAVGPNGERTITAEEFFQDIWTTALEPTEIVREIQIPHAGPSTGQNYQKFRVRAADWAIVGAAVSVERQDGTIGDATVVLTNVGTTPVRARSVEDALRGGEASADAIRAASEHASDRLAPSPELKASPDYKRHLARVMTRRALEAALNLR
jgi:aerobic carbon-monoxide dehydrogenase medium subunit